MQPQPVSVAQGMTGMQPGTVVSPTAVMGGARPTMIGLPSAATVNSGPIVGMQPQPGIMGMLQQPNMYGMQQPGLVGMPSPQQQMMMGMQTGMMGMQYQQNAPMGMHSAMMQPGLMANQQKANTLLDEL